MGYGYGYYNFSNPYALLGLLLVLVGSVLVSIASAKVNHNYRKYALIQVSKNITGKQVAREILDSNGLADVEIRQVEGTLSDHYDPRNRTVNLSKQIYQEASIASVAVAAHECGHALQHKEGYQPLLFRDALVPLCSVGQSLGMISIFIGLIFSYMLFAWIGVLLLVGILLFQIVTLPVEFNASARALSILRREYLQAEEYQGAKTMLTAAALTYVAGMLATLFSLLQIVLTIIGRDRD